MEGNKSRQIKMKTEMKMKIKMKTNMKVETKKRERGKPMIPKKKHNFWYYLHSEKKVCNCSGH